MAPRPTARPRPGKRIPAALLGARLQKATRPKVGRVFAGVDGPGSLQEIQRHKRHVLITFKRDQTMVPVPVWAAVAGGRIYVRSERAGGKIKRLRRYSGAIIAPCNARGIAVGPALAVRGRLLPRGAPEEEIAERALARHYGLGRALFELTVDLLRVDMGYLELTPDQS